jgi:hypothetical protein
MIRVRILAAAVALTLSTVAPFAIQAASAKDPVVLKSSTTPTTLKIEGENLSPGVASVMLGTFGPLTVVTQTATELVVTLPSGLPPANYVLSVQVGNGSSHLDESIVTIGAVGPTGPAGLQARKDLRGPRVRRGPAGSPGAMGAQGPAGPPARWVPWVRWDRKDPPVLRVRRVPPALPEHPAPPVQRGPPVLPATTDKA